MSAVDVDQGMVATAVARVLRQRFPVRQYGEDPMVRVPVSPASLDRLAADIAAALEVDPTAASIGLDLEVLISCVQELAALILGASTDDQSARWLRPLVDAADEAADLLADLGRPLTAELRMELVP